MQVNIKSKLLQKLLVFLGFKPKSTFYKYRDSSVVFEKLPKSWSMKQLDINNESDISFTYEILKMRYSAPQINITSNNLPTYEQHSKFIKTNYMHYYICSVHEYPVVIVYVANSYEFGIFYHINNLKFVFRKYKNDIVIDKAFPFTSRGHVMSASVGKPFIGELLRKHPALRETMQATVKYNNEWSNAMCAGVGFCPVYTTLSYE